MVNTLNSIKFNTIFERVIGHEAEYVNNPKDPGGETKWGISKRSYPHLDIVSLTREDAYLIYQRDFWNVIQGEELPLGLGFQLFDFAVNSGIATAIRYFQRALGVADDGHFGPVSKTAMSVAALSDMILNLNAERLDYMTRLENWPDSGRGWARRIAQNLRYGSLDS